MNWHRGLLKANALCVYEGKRAMFICHSIEDADRIVEMLNRVESLESALAVYRMFVPQEELRRRVDMFNGPIPQTATDGAQANAALESQQAGREQS